MRPSPLAVLALLSFVAGCGAPPVGEEATEDELAAAAPSLASSIVDSAGDDGDGNAPVWAVDAQERVWLSQGLSFGEVGKPKLKMLPAPSSAVVIEGPSAFLLSVPHSSAASRALTRVGLADKRTSSMAPIGAASAYGLAADPSGTVYAVGVTSPGTPDTTLLRFKTDGSVDVVADGFDGTAVDSAVNCRVAQLVVDETSVYGYRRCHAAHGQIVRAPRAGGPPSVLVPGRVASRLAQTTRDLFYATPMELVRQPKEGGAPTVLAVGAMGPFVATRGSDVWFVDAMVVKRVSANGGPATTVAPLPSGTELRAMTLVRDGVLVHVKRRTAASGEANHQLLKLK